jgi:NitT/TauT family transport system substrate-binding protein
MLLFSAYGLHVPSYGLIVRKSAIDKKGDAFRKFVKVQQHTWTYILAGHEKEAVDAILAQRAGQRLDPAILLAQLKADEPYFMTPATKGKPFGTQAQSDWQSTLDAMQSAGILKAPIKPADVFTNQFISNRSSRAAAAARG